MLSAKTMLKLDEIQKFMTEIILSKIKEDKNFCGKIVLEINLNQGGICNSEAFTMHKEHKKRGN